MKIEKFKKDKGNTYKVYFDDDTIIDLYDDVIVKYNLLSNKEMDLDLFNEITDYNTFLNGGFSALSYPLARKKIISCLWRILNKW